MRSVIRKASILLVIMVGGCFSLHQPFGSQTKVSEMIRKNPDHVNMVFVSSSNPQCRRCDMANSFYDGFAQDMSGIVQSYFIDCELVKENPEEMNRLPMCSQERSRKELPIITFFKPEIQDLQTYRWKESRIPQDTPYSGAVSVEHLTDFAKQIMPNYSLKIEEVEQLEEFLAFKAIPTQVILFNSKDATPLTFQGITAQFLNRIDFAEVDDITTKITQRYGVTQFPAILVLKWNVEQNDYDVDRYKGKKTFDDLKTYFTQHALAKPAVKQSGQGGSSIFTDPEVVNIEYTDALSLFKESDRWTLVSVYPRDPSANAEKVENQLKTVKKRFGSMFTFFKLKCDVQDQKCANWLENRLGYADTKSAVNILLPYGQRDSKRLIVLGNDLKLDDIAKEMLKLSPAVETAVDGDQNIMGQIESSKSNKKVLAVWFYNTADAVSRVFIHTISAMPGFAKYVDFWRYADPQPEAVDNWGLPQLPTLRFFFSSNPLQNTYEKMDYPAPQFLYPQLIKLISDRQEILEEDIIKSQTIDEAVDQEKFEELCLRGQSPCMIALVNRAKEGKSNIEIDQFQKAWAALQDQEYKWVWLDGLCHTEILQNFKLTAEQLPAIVYLDTKQLKYQFIAGEFNSKQVVQMIQAANKEKKTLPVLQEELDMDEKDCQRIRQLWKENDKKQKQQAKSKEDL